MALIYRLARLFKADAHAVLDRIEEPQALLKQSIRDMQSDLTQTEQRIAQRVHELETLSRQVRQLDEALTEHTTQLDLCFASGKEALARSVIRKKLAGEQLRAQIHSNAAQLNEQLETQRAALAHKRTTLDSLQQKATLFDVGARTPSGDTAQTATITDDQVEIAMLRERDLRSAS
ncbi:MAG: PspA/IM30 family protein [Pseudomonadota bacterium]